MATPRLGAPELAASQAVPETTVNEQVRYCEQGAGHFVFKDRDLTAPPGSPADGDCYLVAASPTGAWSGQAGKIAFYLSSAWVFVTAKEGFGAYINDEDAFVIFNGTSWQTYERVHTESFVIAVSDEGTDLTTGTAKLTFRMPYAFNLTAVRASVKVAPTGSSIIVDINEGGGSIMNTTKLSIDVGEKTSVTAAAPPVISDGSLADDAEITIDIDQIGSTVAGAGLKVYLIGSRP